MDIFLQKLNPSGTVIWTQYYNGSGSSTDAASAVVVDNATGDVFITGAVTNSFPGFFDIVTIKYDGYGNQVWAATYDYSYFIDIPTSIELSVGKVIVGGFSGSSLTNNDICVIKYDNSTGTQLSISRTTNTNTGAQDVLTCIAADSLGNVYALGRKLSGTANYNIQLQKLDTALNVLWTQNFDGFGQEDVGLNLDLDENLNIYVTGYATKSGANRQMVVLKYDNGGTLQWSKYPNDNANSTSEGYRIKVKNTNEIFVGGNITINSNQDLCMIRLDNSGKVNMYKSYDGIVSGTDKFMDFTLGSNHSILISARSDNGIDDNNIIVHYRYKNFVQGVDSSTGLKYEPKELIIQFNKSALKMSAINNKGFLFGNLNEFVDDSTCDKITYKLDHDGKLGFSGREVSTRKIFVDLAEADSLSFTRSGDYIKVPEYFCFLLLTLPPTVSNVTANSQLHTIKPDIRSTELNLIYELTNTQSANDPQYNLQQGSLHGTSIYPNSNINCDTAWTISGGGLPFVKVGVFDCGVDFTHVDLPGTTIGYDWINNIASNNQDDTDHGTPCAGIIAAEINNSIGIAGIAGKDANSTNGGVTIYDCKVCDGNFLCYGDKVAQGIVKGLQGTNIGGFALHIMNLSLRLSTSYYNSWPYLFSNAVITALNDANRNGVAMAISKGNLDGIPNYAFPADYSDDVAMSIGGTGRDGHHCKYGVNCNNASTMGGYIDFCAPGVDSLIKTLSNTGGYKVESGTSMAAPHISGVIGLMMSYRNSSIPSWDNMVHEDFEHILQRTATDLSLAIPYGEKPLYDSVPAGEELMLVEH